MATLLLTVYVTVAPARQRSSPITVTAHGGNWQRTRRVAGPAVDYGWRR